MLIAYYVEAGDHYTLGLLRQFMGPKGKPANRKSCVNMTCDDRRVHDLWGPFDYAELPSVRWAFAEDKYFSVVVWRQKDLRISKFPGIPGVPSVPIIDDSHDGEPALFHVRLRA